MIRIGHTNLALDADPVAGVVQLKVFTTGQVIENLSALETWEATQLLERARHVVETGIGDMEPRPS